jgi:hypothetical protein
MTFINNNSFIKPQQQHIISQKHLKVNDVIAMIDTEAYLNTTRKQYLSEVFILIVQILGFQKYKVLDKYHVFVKPPELWKYIGARDLKMMEYVRDHVTGLDPQKLEQAGGGGKHFLEVRQEIQCLFRKYPGIIKLARDPDLEKKTLSIYDIEEICDYLKPPYGFNFLSKENRPKNIRIQMNKMHICDKHDAITLSEYMKEKFTNHHQDSMHLFYQHCAKADVYELFNWIFYYGSIV